MKKNYKFQRTTLLTVWCGAVLVGLAAAKFETNIQFAWVGLSAVFALICFSKRSILSMLSIVLFGFILGVSRGSLRAKQLVVYESLYARNVTVQAKAESDGVYTEDGQLEFDVSSVQITQPFDNKPPGKLKIQARGVPAIYRGDIVEVTGKLFPAGGSRQGKISYAEVKVLGRSGLWTEKVRHEFIAGMQTAMPDPQASFGLGLLIGQRTTLPVEVTEMLSIVGLTHIIAVSGYNLTIIVRGTRRVLGKRSKYQSIVISVSLIVLFLLFTGFSASIVRASVVSFLSLLAWYYGRTFKPLLLLGIAAVMTALWNPIYIWSDIGWYLSFLAFFGVLVIAPLVAKLIYGNSQPKFLTQIIIESLSAQIMAMPLILYIFSEASLVAIVSNVFVVPLVPFAMLFSLLAGIGGMLVPVISGWIALPATFITTYMLDLVLLFSKVPHAKVKLAVSLLGTLLFYASILGLTILLARKVSNKHGKITDETTLL